MNSKKVPVFKSGIYSKILSNPLFLRPVFESDLYYRMAFNGESTVDYGVFPKNHDIEDRYFWVMVLKKFYIKLTYSLILRNFGKKGTKNRIFAVLAHLLSLRTNTVSENQCHTPSKEPCVNEVTLREQNLCK